MTLKRDDASQRLDFRFLMGINTIIRSSNARYVRSCQCQNAYVYSAKAGSFNLPGCIANNATWTKEV